MYRILITSRRFRWKWLVDGIGSSIWRYTGLQDKGMENFWSRKRRYLLVWHSLPILGLIPHWSMSQERRISQVLYYKTNQQLEVFRNPSIFHHSRSIHIPKRIFRNVVHEVPRTAECELFYNGWTSSLSRIFSWTLLQYTKLGKITYACFDVDLLLVGIYDIITNAHIVKLYTGEFFIVIHVTRAKRFDPARISVNGCFYSYLAALSRIHDSQNREIYCRMMNPPLVHKMKWEEISRIVGG